MVGVLSCYTTLQAVWVSDLSTGTNVFLTGISVIYEVNQFSSGSILVTGTVNNPGFGVSSLDYYIPPQGGFANGNLSLTFDVVPPSDNGFWQLSVNRSNWLLAVVYTDADMAVDSLTWTTPAAGPCTLYGTVSP